MRCPECGYNNIAGSLFCEHCGADLEKPRPEMKGAAVSTDPAGESPQGPSSSQRHAKTPVAETANDGKSTARKDVIRCAQCGADNPADYRVCQACGRPLTLAADDQPRRQLETPEVRRQTARTPTAKPAASATPSTGDKPTGNLPVGQRAIGPQKGKVKLVVEQGMVVGKQFLLNSDQILVGREDAGEGIFPGIDLSGLDEGYVHRRHAMLTFEGSFLFVTHLGGHNRTYVNNRPIADDLPVPLDVGDTVRFGKVVLRLEEV